MKGRTVRTYLFFFILFISVSCSKKPAEEAAEAIDIALTHLGKEECDDAIKVLEDLDDMDDNAIYLQVLASAYACKAGYKEIAVVDDLGNLDSSTPAGVFKSIATMTYSPETSADSEDYVYLRQAINLILGSTSGAPAHDSRVTKFGSRKAGDMSVQALLLNISNFGKFLYYYGNVDTNGNKGQGSNTNVCFLDYTDSDAQTVISGGAGGVCNNNTSGHPDLDLTTDAGKRRVCEGLMLLTNIFDVLDNLDLSGSDELSALEDVSTQVDTYRSAAVAVGLGYLFDMTSQSECVTSMNTPANLADMEYLYALVFETGLQ